MKEIELKPCPFCGGKAKFVSETATIKCTGCGGAYIVTNPLLSRFEVAHAWNERINGGVCNEQRSD